MESIDQRWGVLDFAPPAPPGDLKIASWSSLGALWEGFGALSGLSRGSFRALGALLGLSGGPLGSPNRASQGHLGGYRSKEGGSFRMPPPLGPSKPPLGALLRPSWGALGAVLGASWAPLGAFLGRLGAILKPQKPIGSEKARRYNSVVFFRYLKDLGLLGGSLEGSGGTWGRPWAVLRAPGGRLKTILNHVGLSCAILEAILASLEPSWSHLGPSWTP